MDKTVIFIAGIYGVGKSTLCDKLKEKFNVSSFSAGDLISEINGETYGKNKVVKDKNENQNILISAVKKKLEEQPTFLLAGHFCIFNKSCDVEVLPDFVFKEIPISKIILLEADVQRVVDNIKQRDSKAYGIEAVERLALAERTQAESTSAMLGIPLYIHKMQFTQKDIEEVSTIINGVI